MNAICGHFRINCSLPTQYSPLSKRLPPIPSRVASRWLLSFREERTEVRFIFSWWHDFYHIIHFTAEVKSNTVQGNRHHDRAENVIANVVKANIPVSNGIVHLIDKPLVVIATTLWDYLKQEEAQVTYFTITSYSTIDMRDLFYPTYRAEGWASSPGTWGPRATPIWSAWSRTPSPAPSSPQATRPLTSCPLPNLKPFSGELNKLSH